MGVESGLDLATPAESKSAAAKVAAAMGLKANGINAIAQNIGAGVAGQLSSAVGPSKQNGGDAANTLSSLPIGLAAFNLAQGIGQGTSIGLNLSQASASPSNGSNLLVIARNLGLGISTPIASTINFKNLTSQASASFSSVPLGLVAFSLAQGIGQGVSTGLNLTQKQFDPANNSDFTSLAQNLGLGIASPIASSVDVQTLIKQARASEGISMARLSDFAGSIGAGLGEGASRGLGLEKTDPSGTASRKRQAAQNPNAQDFPGIVQNFTMGLSEAFLQSSDLNKTLSSIGLNVNLSNISLLSLASGAGRGVGEGIAIGLNTDALRNLSSNSSVVSGNGVDLDQERAAELFTKGLLATFLQNGGVKSVSDAISAETENLTASVDVRKTAEGVARGLVEGSIHALSQAGGFQKVLAGDFPVELAFNISSLPASSFNDSLNGSAVAFTRGLASEGILLISKLIKSGKENSTLLKRGATESVGMTTSLFNILCTNGYRLQKSGTAPSYAGSAANDAFFSH
jgi:hypothetical protein